MNATKTPTLYLMLGYPGSGKTTTARLIRELTGAVHIWEDQKRLETNPHPVFSQSENDRLHTLLNTQTGELLGQGTHVIYDTSFNRREDRRRMYDIADACGATVKLIWLQTDKETARQRATKDTASQPTRILATVLGDMDQETFNRLSDKLETPEDTEPYIAVDGTRVTRDYLREKLGL